MKITFEKMEGEDVWHVAIDEQHMTMNCSESLDQAMKATLETAANILNIRRQAGAIHVVHVPLGIDHPLNNTTHD